MNPLVGQSDYSPPVERQQNALNVKTTGTSSLFQKHVFLVWKLLTRACLYYLSSGPTPVQILPGKPDKKKQCYLIFVQYLNKQ